MTRLEGQTALVTGGGTGIGRAVAIRLAEEGARVVVTGRRAAEIEETAGLVRDAGGEAEAIRGDVSVEADAARMAEETIGRFGRLTVLVNNAGVIRRDQPAGATPPEDWDSVLDVNLKGVYLVCRAALPHLSAEGGAIVNVSSIMAIVSAPGTAAYQASKAALSGLTRSMAQDYAPSVRVNSVLPGLVHTPISYVDRPDFDDRLAEYEEMFPLGRIGRPDDIAAAVAFLASADASWITGAELVVDGGYTIS